MDGWIRDMFSQPQDGLHLSSLGQSVFGSELAVFAKEWRVSSIEFCLTEDDLDTLLIWICLGIKIGIDCGWMSQTNIHKISIDYLVYNMIGSTLDLLGSNFACHRFSFVYSFPLSSAVPSMVI